MIEFSETSVITDDSPDGSLELEERTKRVSKITRSAWRNQILNSYEQLSLQVMDAHARGQLTGIPYEKALDLLATARSHADPRHRGDLDHRKLWYGLWTGSDLDVAWGALHETEALLIENLPDSMENWRAVHRAQDWMGAKLKSDHPLMKALARANKKGDESVPPAGTMKLAADGLRAARSINDEEHRRARNFRNTLFVTTVLLTALAAVLAIIGARAPVVLNLCWPDACPSGPGTGPLWGDVLTVEMLGVLGAALTAAIAVRRLRSPRSTYAVALWSIAVKLPTGAITAVLGLALLRVLDSFELTSPAQIAAWAIVFGASQELVTRLIDDRAQIVLDSVGKDKTEKSGDPAAKEDA